MLSLYHCVSLPFTQAFRSRNTFEEQPKNSNSLHCFIFELQKQARIGAFSVLELEHSAFPIEVKLSLDDEHASVLLKSSRRQAIQKSRRRKMQKVLLKVTTSFCFSNKALQREDAKDFILNEQVFMFLNLLQVSIQPL